MGNVNKVIIVGNLGADPELKQTTGGRTVCNLRLATSEVYKDKAGVKQQRTEWHRVSVWGDPAEHCGRYLTKGRMVYVEGRLEHRSWDDKDGQKHWTTDVVASRVIFLGQGRPQDTPQVGQPVEQRDGQRDGQQDRQDDRPELPLGRTGARSAA